MQTVDKGGPDAALVVLLVIAVITAACAAYTLLTVSGVLDGGWSSIKYYKRHNVWVCPKSPIRLRQHRASL